MGLSQLEVKCVFISMEISHIWYWYQVTRHCELVIYARREFFQRKGIIFTFHTTVKLDHRSAITFWMFLLNGLHSCMFYFSDFWKHISGDFSSSKYIHLDKQVNGPKKQNDCIFIYVFLQLVSRGKVHIFKYLEIQAIKEDRKRGVLTDTEYRRSYRKTTTGQLSDIR